MTPVKKYCDCRAWPAGALVTFAGGHFRATRDTAKGENPLSAPDAWQPFDPRGAMTPPPNSMTAVPR